MKETSLDTEDWAAIRKADQERRAANRDAAVTALMAARIQFVSKNDGAHLIVHDGRYDFWPSNGLYRKRNSKQKRRGLQRLIAEIQGGYSQPCTHPSQFVRQRLDGTYWCHRCRKDLGYDFGNSGGVES